MIAKTIFNKEKGINKLALQSNIKLSSSDVKNVLEQMKTGYTSYSLKTERFEIYFTPDEAGNVQFNFTDNKKSYYPLLEGKIKTTSFLTQLMRKELEIKRFGE